VPNTKSAIKAAKQNIKRRKANLLTIDKVRSAVKTYKKLAIENKDEEARKALDKVFSALDKAVKKNVIHKNRSARRKSRLSKLIAKKK
jgi:small subunit ribosomal protein S20